MSKVLLSVVIPVFNVEKYLVQFLDSLLLQVYVPDEVIFVDDGSTDKSVEIIESYLGKFESAIFLKQENFGCSEARNSGAKIAKGKYISFVDSDDVLHTNYYSAMLDVAESYSLDMVIVNAFNNHEGRKNNELIYNNSVDTGVVSGANFLKAKLLEGCFLHMVWMHLYRREFLENNNFSFIPGIFHQDVIWTTKCLLKAEKVMFLAEPLYSYRILQRRLNSDVMDIRMVKVIDSSIINLLSLVSIADDLSDKELRGLIINQAIDGAFSIFHKLDQINNKLLKKNCIVKLKSKGVFKVMWSGSSSFKQYRKILGRYIKYML